MSDLRSRFRPSHTRQPVAHPEVRPGAGGAADQGIEGATGEPEPQGGARTDSAEAAANTSLTPISGAARLHATIPIGYDVDTIWFFDNSFIAWGLRRCGFKDEAARISAMILDAAIDGVSPPGLVDGRALRRTAA